VRAIVGPGADRLNELTGRNKCSVAGDRHEIALSARLEPQHAKAVLRIVECDALDKPGKVLSAEVRLS